LYKTYFSLLLKLQLNKLERLNRWLDYTENFSLFCRSVGGEEKKFYKGLFTLANYVAKLFAVSHIDYACLSHLGHTPQVEMIQLVSRYPMFVER
jgi:hypothetical protein